jgi:hypothetical protein
LIGLRHREIDDGVEVRLMRMRIEAIGEEVEDGIPETMDGTETEIEMIADLILPSLHLRISTDMYPVNEADAAQVIVVLERADDQARDESSVRGETRMGIRWWEGGRERQPRSWMRRWRIIGVVAMNRRTMAVQLQLVAR